MSSRVIRTSAVDLFAGPGGWDIAAERLGIESLGVELDKWACKTRDAAGLMTHKGDVSALWLTDWVAEGLIASPPCQTFSMAGNGAGRAGLDQVLQQAESLSLRNQLDYSKFEDIRTGLVLEPLRYALEAIDSGNPYEWLAFEQVPTVRPVWEAFAEILSIEGYRVDTGVLHAEQFGVPQTRKRAILVAHIEREVSLPAPTHRKYKKGVAQHEGDQSLLPWVSMAEALGWNGATMRSNYGTGGDPANRGTRDMDEPAPTVTSKADRNKWLVQSTQANATVRSSGEPAPAITGGKAHGDRHWAPHGVKVTAAEAARLQTFPDDYPFQGPKGKVFQQIGNAIPPLLAEHILRAVNTG